MLRTWLISLEDVHLAETAAEREAIYRFRYDVYVGELNKQVSDVDHAQRWLHDEDDEAPGTALFYTGKPGAVTGTMRVLVWQPGQVPARWATRYGIAQIPHAQTLTLAESGRLMVSRSHRGKLLLPALAAAAMTHAIQCGVAVGFANCAPGLVAAYSRLGFRPYHAELLHTADGLRVPLAGVPADLEGLRAAHSPMATFVLRALTQFPLELPPPDTVRALFGRRAAVQTDAAEVWHVLQDQLLDAETRSPFVESISADALKVLASKGFVLEVAEARLVVRENLLDRELFIVLDGRFEVQHDERRIALLEAGDIFGEVAFLLDAGRRSASIFALGPGRLLVLRRRFLDELADDDPQLAIQLYRNLSRILARRVAAMVPRVDVGA